MDPAAVASSTQVSFGSSSESSSSSATTQDNNSSTTKRSRPGDSSSDSDDATSGLNFCHYLLQKQPTSHEYKWLMSVMLGWMMKGTKGHVVSISNIEIPRSNSRVTTRFSEVHGSYSWTEKKDATIYVPGGPRIFKAGDENGRFPPANASPRKYVDENSMRMPLYSFEPMFRALLAADHPYMYDDVDIVTDSTTLHKLLLFCTDGCEFQGFRIDVNMIDKTMFLTLREKHGKPSFKDDEAAGAGLRFPTKLTEPRGNLKDSTSFWRILRYNLGRLNCVVRSEVDAAYYGEDVKEGTSLPALGHLLEVPSAKEKKNTHNGERSTRVIIRGRTTHAGVTAAIATKHRINTMGDLMPQLYFARTRWLLEVTQKADKKGPYLMTEATNVMMSFRKWQMCHQANLQRLVKLLETIRHFARENGGRCIAICENTAVPPKIHIFSSRVATDPLPEDVIAQFWSAHAGDEGGKAKDGGPSPRSQSKTAVSMSILMNSDEDDSEQSSDDEDAEACPTCIRRVGLDVPEQSQQTITDLRKDNGFVYHDVTMPTDVESGVSLGEHATAGHAKSNDDAPEAIASRDTQLENNVPKAASDDETIDGNISDEDVLDDGGQMMPFAVIGTVDDWIHDMKDMGNDDVENEDDWISDVEIAGSDLDLEIKIEIFDQ